MNSNYIFSSNVVIILLICLIVLVITNISILVIYIYKYRKFVEKYNSIWSKFDNKNIEDDIKKMVECIRETEKECQSSKSICSEIEGKMIKCIQKVGFIKYSAYDSGNNELSFVIVLLDNENNGLLLNSIYNRNYSNMYAKEVINGEVNGILSDEEISALQKAINDKSFI